MDIPAQGYPINESAIREWFRTRHGREGTPLEIGDILLAMTARDSTAPVYAPDPDSAGPV